MIMQDEEVGPKLRSAREAAKLSQRALAKKTGVANATISQIESGSFNPTVGILKKILGGIPMSLSEFFADAPFNLESKFVYRANQLTELSDGGVSYRQVGGDLNGKAIQLMFESYQPRSSTGRHELNHEGEECGLIIKGRLTVTVGGKTEVLGPGDAYYFNSELPHSFRNDENEVCELVSACSPPTF